MDADAFGEIMLWLEGAYARTFPEATRKAAWTLLHRFPDEIVKQAAVRMVEMHERFPTPALWVQIAIELHEEARERARMAASPVAALPKPPERSRRVARPRAPGETDEQRIAYLKELIGTDKQDGTARAEDCQEYIRLILARPYPAGHPLAR